MPASKRCEKPSRKKPEFGFICPVCGRSFQGKIIGSFKHPLCLHCFRDDEKYLVWIEQMRREHPELYEVVILAGRKTIGR